MVRFSDPPATLPSGDANGHSAGFCGLLACNGRGDVVHACNVYETDINEQRHLDATC